MSTKAKPESRPVEAPKVGGAPRQFLSFGSLALTVSHPAEADPLKITPCCHAISGRKVGIELDCPEKKCQRLRVGSGLELTQQLVQEERCPLPILLGGPAEDVALKRNRAIAAGAVDFIAVEPFHVLSLLRTLEETLRLFG